ncbi:MAG TPA: hypothetical protein VM915_07440 [Verrucomicrobiae bacterium]|nr:hypothetical protein [Verrucomicrobiae bacterium]
MIKRAGFAVLALVLAACTPPEAPTQTAEVPSAQLPPPVTGCVANTSRDWSAVGSQYYIIEAELAGDACPDAVATIRIKAREGNAVLFEQNYPIAGVPLAFNPNGDRVSLSSDLEAWIQNTAEVQTADTLPAWPSGAQRPPGFQPAAGVTRQRYEGARGAQGPLFCYPDGAESNACIAMAGDTATLLGSLTPERP